VKQEAARTLCALTQSGMAFSLPCRSSSFLNNSVVCAVCGTAENQVIIVDALPLSLQVLLNSLDSGSRSTQATIAAVLKHLALSDGNQIVIATFPRALACLLSAVQSASNGAQPEAAATLANLALNSTLSIVVHGVNPAKQSYIFLAQVKMLMLAFDGLLPTLLFSVANSSALTQEAATLALSRLADYGRLKPAFRYFRTRV
jgi:hypothetical protein